MSALSIILVGGAAVGKSSITIRVKKKKETRKKKNMRNKRNSKTMKNLIILPIFLKNTKHWIVCCWGICGKL